MEEAVSLFIQCRLAQHLRAAASWLAFQALPRLSLSLILLPSATDLGSLQKSWKKNKHPLPSIVGASMEAQFPLESFTLKETDGGLNPPLAGTTSESWSNGNNWQNNLMIQRSDLKWPHFQTIKHQTFSWHTASSLSSNL